MDHIPKLIEQYKSQSTAIEKDLPMLRKIVGGIWKKEEELRKWHKILTVEAYRNSKRQRLLLSE